MLKIAILVSKFLNVKTTLITLSVCNIFLMRFLNIIVKIFSSIFFNSVEISDFITERVVIPSGHGINR